MITIVVGPEGSEAEFLIYTDMAKRHSKVLEANIQLATGPEKSRLRATEHSAEHFKFFVSFIYTGRIHTVTKSTERSEWRLLSELWVLGDALESTTFKDAVVDAMLERRAMFNEFHDQAYVIMADHLQTPQQTRMGVGKLLVDTAVSARKHDIYTDKLSSMPGCLHFYGEVIKGLDRIRRRVESEQEVLLRATKGLDCVYHEHGTNEICYRKMFPVTRSSVRHSHNSMPQ
jgi:allantoicase